jgi:hypothetical protein
MRFEDFYLNEMIVIGKPQDKKYIVAFDKWIWIIDDESKEELKDIAEKLKMDYNEENAYSFLQSVSENYGDVLVGQISGKNLYLMDYGSFKADPKSSILVKKVVNQLKLNSASYIEDFDSTETKISKKKMTAEIPNIGYHGTSSRYLSAIVSKGLKSGESDSNYARQGIHHPDLVFFTTRIGEAMHHAQTTASQKGGVPIILEFEIPDKDQIIADYDVEKMTKSDIYYGNTGDRGKYQAQAYKQDPDKLSKHFGVYGYKQRIPSKFIKSVWVATKPSDEIYNIKDFKKMKPKTVLKMIDQGYF